MGWAARRLHLLMPVGIVFAVVGAALFWIPYQLTGMIVNRLRLEQDVRSTWKLLIGIVLYALWLVALVIVAGTTFGWAGRVAHSGGCSGGRDDRACRFANTGSLRGAMRVASSCCDHAGSLIESFVRSRRIWLVVLKRFGEDCDLEDLEHGSPRSIGRHGARIRSLIRS